MPAKKKPAKKQKKPVSSRWTKVKAVRVRQVGRRRVVEVLQ